MTECIVYVEGRSDAVLVDSLLSHMNVASISARCLGGGHSKLKAAAPSIRRTYDAGKRIALLLDANASLASRRETVGKAIDGLNLPVDKDAVFFLPDDTRSGCLEDLLEEMAVSAHRPIYGCFDHYGDCLRGLDESYKLPSRKARVYAYCDALGIEARSARREYADSKHWNMDAPALKPLKEFLRSLHC